MANAVHAISGVWATLDRHVDDLDPDQLRRLLDVLGHQTELLQALLGDLTEVARVEGESLRVEVEPVVLRDAVDAAIACIDADGRAPLIRVAVADDLVVLADPFRLRQVLVNLLGNARLHGGPQTWVDATRLGDGAVVTVSDDGTGVGDHEPDRLFTPYRRGDASADRPGSGLGLAIVRELVRAMGGDVRHVRRPRGTQFAVELPLAGPGPDPVYDDLSGVLIDPPFDHAVVLYDRAEVAHREIADMVQAGLEAGDGVVVVATPGNWAGAARVLASRGIETASGLDDEQLVVLDAADTLGLFHDEDGCHPYRFHDVVCDLVQRLTRRFGHVRAYDDMVALLAERAGTSSAVQLEQFWNRLYRNCHVGLLCGYPAAPGLDVEDAHRTHGFVYQA